jgi:two-component system, NtrC family, response regulator AtoC
MCGFPTAEGPSGQSLEPRTEIGDVNTQLADDAEETVELVPLSEARCCPEELIGDSDAMRRIGDLINRVAPGDTTVLVTGETGTGKELAARAIHRLSHRGKGPLVCVNCCAIPDTLLESELFGHERGAFTGAEIRQHGKLRQADGGTLFLDEVGDMALTAQSKILRAIENREVQPLGGKGTTPIDIRLVAATNTDLQELVAERKFRPDLYFRLCVVPLRMPALRERLEDIPALVSHFIAELNAHYGRNVEGMSGAGLRMLQQQSWPGNVRQLRNVVEGAYVVCSSRCLSTADLRWFHWSPSQPTPIIECVRSSVLPRYSVQPDPDRFLKTLQETHWNKSKTAQILQVSRMTVYRQIAKYNLTHRPGAPVNSAPAAKTFGATAGNDL